MTRLYGLFALLLITICSIWSCSQAEDKLLGEWERFGDKAEGTIVSVEKTGDTYRAKLKTVEGVLDGLGFKPSDIKWRKIKHTDAEKYEGQDLQKGVNTDGNVVEDEYVEVHFELISEDVLLISGFSQGKEYFGTSQQWRKLPE